MKNKMLLLASAVALLSPVAAKANQKSSIFLGGTGAFERLAYQYGEAAVSDYLKDETFTSIGLEAGVGYKVYSNLQLAGVLRGLYSFEHKYGSGKTLPSTTTARVDPSSIIIEPRVTLGWEASVGNNFTVTPFLGVGLELNISEHKTKEWKTDTKVPFVVGARFGFSPVYVSLNARYDLTSAAINNVDSSVGRTEADAVRFWGVDLSVGAEF